MTAHPEPINAPTSAPQVPEITYPIRKRCKNCPKFFTITQKRGKHRKFCSVDCKNEFSRNGSAWGSLKEQIEKLVEKKTREAARGIATEELIKALRAAGFIHRSQVKKLKPEHTFAGMQGQLDMYGRLLRELRADLVSFK